MPYPSAKDDRVSIKKQVRKNQVINLLRTNGAMSRFDISKATGYSPPVIAQLVADLIEENMVEEIGKGESIGGRRPILIDLIDRACYVIGIELGQHHATAVLMGLKNTIIEQVEVATSAQESSAQSAESMGRAIREMLSRQPEQTQNLLGIGIAFPGMVDRNTPPGEDKNAPYLEIVEVLRNEFDVNVWFDNDAGLMALSEKWYGMGRELSDFVVINLDYGVGSGLVLNNQYYRGSHGHAGEFGHMKFKTLVERECHCGGKGCLETVAGGWALDQEVRAYVEKHPDSAIARLVAEAGHPLAIGRLAVAAREGDAFAQDLFARAADYLGLAISSLLNILNPQAVVLGGPMAAEADLFIDAVRDTVKLHALDASRSQFSIELSTLGNKSVALGACALVIENVFVDANDDILQLV